MSQPRTPQHNNQQIVAIASPSGKQRSLRDVYFKQLTQNLDQDIITLVSTQIIDQNEQQIAKVSSSEIEIGVEDAKQFIKQEQIKYRKASLERIHHKQGIKIQKDIEKKLLLNKDLAVVDLSANYSPQNYKSTSIVLTNYNNQNNNEDETDKNKQNYKSVTDYALEQKNFVKKLNEEKRERERKKQEKMRMEQEKLQKEIDDRQKKLEDEKTNQLLEKEKKMEEIQKRIHDRIQNREISQQRMVQETKKISKKPKLYQEIEKKFVDENQREADRQRLEKLKEIKEKHQPLNKDDIENHARKYEDIIRQKKEELRRKRGGLELNYESSDNLKNYKSKFYLELIEGQKQQKELQDKEKVEKKRLADKANSYAKYVKEMYWPQASEDKKMELDQMKENLRHPIRKVSDGDDQPPQLSYQQRRNIMRHGTADNKVVSKPKYKQDYSVRNLQQVDSQRSSQRNLANNDFQSDPEFSQINEEQPRLVVKKKKQLRPMALNNKNSDENQKPPVKDYLREFKSKRDGDNTAKRSQIADLDRVLKSQNFSDAEKYNLVKLKTDQLEQKAEQEEKMLSMIGSGRNVDRALEVNDMYIESIKAKLMMLDQI